MTFTASASLTQTQDVHKLISDRDFLGWTLARPEQAAAVSWQLANGTRVDVWDTGVNVSDASALWRPRHSVKFRRAWQ